MAGDHTVLPNYNLCRSDNEKKEYLVNIKIFSALGLMNLQTQIMDELVARDIVQNPTQPVGDYATHLACKAFDLRREPTSTSGYDATDDEGLRYQIKYKRLMKPADTRQLNAVKGLEQKKFDFLIGVLFQADMAIYRAALIPFDVAARLIDSSAKILMLNNKVWDMDDVIDITDKMKNAQA